MPRFSESYVLVDPEYDNTHGQWNHAHLHDTAAWKAYQRKVREITRWWYPGTHYEGGRGPQAKYHRDHLLSIRDGYEQGIDAEVIAHPVNCRRVPAHRNLRKGRNSSITKDELLLMYKSYGKLGTPALSLTAARAKLARVRRHHHRGQGRRIWLTESKRYAWLCPTCHAAFARQF